MIPLALLLAAPTTWHVAPNGDDARDGRSAARAFATITRATQAARAGDTVLVQPGVYRRTDEVRCSGLPGRPVTIRPAKPGTVTFSGADPVTGFRPVGAGVFAAPMPWTFAERFQSDQLFAGGEAMEALRWPKNTGTAVLPTDARVVEAKDAGGDRIALRFDPPFDEPDGRWTGARVWVNLSHLGKNWGQDGQAQTGTVVATDRKTGVVTLSGISKISWEGGYNPDRPWGIGEGTEVHLFDPTPEGVAATGGPGAALGPNEFWRDGAAGRVYVRPRSGGPAGIEARRRSWALDLSGRSYVTVEGFRIFAASVTTDDGAEGRSDSVAPSHHVILRNLRARYLTHGTDHSGQFQMQWLQKSGIRLSGSDQTLEGCVLEDATGPLVSVIGRRNRVIGNTLRRGNTGVSEAGAMDCGRAYDPRATISTDHEIAWNTIEDSPQQGINLRGLVNSDPARPGVARVHHNLIRRVMLRAYDSAAIDQFGTDGQGVRIDHNVISDLVGSLRIGIYVDFGSGYVIERNLVTNVDRPIQINWNDPKKPCRTIVERNTCLSTGPWFLPGVLNGAGDVNPGSAARFNVSTNGVSFGKDAENSGNVKAEPGLFVDPEKGDYRPKAPLDAGAFEFGKPMWRAGAASRG